MIGEMIALLDKITFQSKRLEAQAKLKKMNSSKQWKM